MVGSKFAVGWLRLVQSLRLVGYGWFKVCGWLVGYGWFKVCGWLVGYGWFKVCGWLVTVGSKFAVGWLRLVQSLRFAYLFTELTPGDNAITKYIIIFVSKFRLFVVLPTPLTLEEWGHKKSTET